MPCAKKAYVSPQSAKKALRGWRRLARRSNFDRAHIYPADCQEHKGKFHIGLKHERGDRRIKKLHSMGPHERVEMLDALDDVFDKQVQRIVGTLSKTERRMQRCLDPVEGPLVQPETTICKAGDRIDVENRK